MHRWENKHTTSDLHQTQHGRSAIHPGTYVGPKRVSLCLVRYKPNMTDLLLNSYCSCSVLQFLIMIIGLFPEGRYLGFITSDRGMVYLGKYLVLS